MIKIASMWIFLQMIFIGGFIFYGVSGASTLSYDNSTATPTNPFTETVTLGNITGKFANYLNPLSNQSIFQGGELNLEGSQWAIYNFVLNPGNWTGSEFITFLAGLMAVGLAAGVLFSRFDLPIMFPLFLLFIASGAPGVIMLQKMINAEIGALACGGADISCMPAGFISILLAGSLGVYWVFACIGWWTNRQTT